MGEKKEENSDYADGDYNSAHQLRKRSLFQALGTVHWGLKKTHISNVLDIVVPNQSDKKESALRC